MENKQDILKKLGSSDIDLVSEAIEQIKTEGDLSIVPGTIGYFTAMQRACHYHPYHFSPLRY